MVARPPAGMHASARNGPSSGTSKVNGVRAGRMRQSPAPIACSAPSTVATARPSSPRNTSSQSISCSGLVVPGASSTRHRLSWEAPRDGAA